MKALALLAALTLGSAQALSGQLAYVTAQGATIEDLSSGKKTVLPNSKGAQLVSLSPRDGMAVYFVTLGSGDLYSDNPAPLRGFSSAAPYTASKPLPAPLNRLAASSLEWAQDGSYVQADYFRYDPRLGKVWKTPEFRPRSSSRSGQVTAWQTGEPSTLNRLMVAGGKGGERAVYSNLVLERWKALSGTDPKDPIAQDPSNWWVSDPAVSPDGQAVYFALNGGQSGGAAGNTQYSLFKLDTATDRAVKLERFDDTKEGDIQGRLPLLRVSPDGKKLLSLGSFHVSAVENPSFFTVLDLVGGKTMSLAWEKYDPKKGEQLTNWISSGCWLADSRTVALSGAQYDVAPFNKEGGDIDQVKRPRHPQDFALYLIDSSTGKLVKRIAGASSPSCR